MRILGHLLLHLEVGEEVAVDSQILLRAKCLENLPFLYFCFNFFI